MKMKMVEKKNKIVCFVIFFLILVLYLIGFKICKKKHLEWNNNKVILILIWFWVSKVQEQEQEQDQEQEQEQVEAQVTQFLKLLLLLIKGYEVV